MKSLFSVTVETELLLLVGRHLPEKVAIKQYTYSRVLRSALRHMPRLKDAVRDEAEGVRGHRRRLIY